MKIMQVNAVYPSGSTGKIVQDIHNYLIENGYESIVCYGRGKKVNKQHIYKTAPEIIMKLQSLYSKITGYAYAGCYISTWNLIKIIKDEKPDIVHLHCINAYTVNIYKLLCYLKDNNIQTVLTLHAEFMHTAGCGHALECEKWKTGCGKCPQAGNGRPSSQIFDRSAKEWMMMKKAFKNFDKIIITPVSDWLCERVKQSPFLKNKPMQVVLNGLDTKNVFKSVDTSNLRKKYKITNEKIILHVTPNFNNPIKGGKYVLALAERMRLDNIRFFIVGFNGNKNMLPPNIQAVDLTQNQHELVQFYSLADITLLTSIKETFSMVCAESLSCGTPVVGFKAGAPETISLSDYSEFVEYNDLDMLETVVRKWINKKKSISNEIVQCASDFYSKQKMVENYEKIYIKINR